MTVVNMIIPNSKSVLESCIQRRNALDKYRSLLFKVFIQLGIAVAKSWFLRPVSTQIMGSYGRLVGTYRLPHVTDKYRQIFIRDLLIIALIYKMYYIMTFVDMIISNSKFVLKSCIQRQNA